MLFIALLACSQSEDEPVDTGERDLSTTQVTNGGTYTVSYGSDPSPIPFDELFSMTVAVEDLDGPSKSAAVDVNAVMPSHGHGMTTVATVVGQGDGTYAVDGMQFHMLGHWRIDVTVEGEVGRFNVDCCDDQ